MTRGDRVIELAAPHRLGEMLYVGRDGLVWVLFDGEDDPVALRPHDLDVCTIA